MKTLTLAALGIAVLVSGCVVYPGDRYQHYDGRGSYRDAPRYDDSRGNRYWYRDRYRYRQDDHDPYHNGRADG